MEFTLFLDYFFLAITSIGNPFFWAIVSALLYWRGQETDSFFLMNTVVFAGIADSFFKLAFKVPRPPVSANFSGWLENRFYIPANEYSFPSGHAVQVSAAFAFFYSKIRKNWKIIFGAAVVLVMVSRVYLGKHFPADVFGGLVLGLMVGKIVFWSREWFEKNAKLNTVAQRRLGIAVVGIVFLAVLFLFENILYMSVVLGYYAGVFLFKGLNLDNPKINGKNFLVKSFVGLLGFAAIFFPAAFFLNEEALQAVLLFFSGLWITFIFPYLVQAKKPN